MNTIWESAFIFNILKVIMRFSTLIIQLPSRNDWDTFLNYSGSKIYVDKVLNSKNHPSVSVNGTDISEVIFVGGFA